MKPPPPSYLWLTGVATAALVLVLFFLPFRKAPHPALAAKPVFAATFYPLYDITRNVTGESAIAKLIVPPGVSTHLFEFSPKQPKTLQNVRAVFAIGHGLDNWPVQAANVIPGARVLTVGQGITLRTFDDGTPDPHYWFHFANARKIADNIANTLSLTNPAHAGAYREHASAYKARLREKERERKDLRAPVRAALVLTFHHAWLYFAANFGPKIAGAFAPAAGTEPMPRYLAQLQRKRGESKDEPLTST